jgi:hypothetical protein
MEICPLEICPLDFFHYCVNYGIYELNQGKKVTNEEKIRYWVDLSSNDLAVAETLMKNGHNLYAGFMCHQAVEKILKGYFAKVKNDTPPFKHDLEYLAQQSDSPIFDK